MRVAVIGAGSWGINLIRTFHSLGVLAVIVEDKAVRRKELEREFPQVEVIGKFDANLIKSCEAVAIATPVCTHFELSLMALQAGLDVFVEKPMTLNLLEAERLSEVAKSSDRVFMVGHLLLYQPAIRWLKQAIDGGAIGKVFAYHQNRLGFGKVRSQENALLSLGVHDLSVLTYLAGGAPVKISTNGQSKITSHIEDDVHCHMWFEDESVAHLHVSWLWPERERKLTIVGEKGMLVYDELASCITHHKKFVASNLSLIDEGHAVVFRAEEAPLKLELQHFLQCVSERSRPLTDVENGLSIMRLLHLANLQLEAAHG